MIRIGDINDVRMYHVREHEIGSFGRQQVVHELQRTFVCSLYVCYVLYVLGNPQKRDTDVYISPVQFLRDRKLGIRDEKHGIVIKEPVSDWSLLARQKVYPWLRDKCYEDEYEKRYWWNRNVSEIKDDYYWAKKIADKSQGWCIKIPASNKKCVELLTIYGWNFAILH